MSLPAKILDFVVDERQDNSSNKAVENGSPESFPVAECQMICLFHTFR